MAHVKHEVTIQLAHNQEWQAFKEEVEAAGVPPTAKMSPYHYDSLGDPRESDYTNIIFEW